MTWLVTGGAGYIGAHVVRAMRLADLEVVVVDDLSTGRKELVPSDVELVEGSVLDGDLLADVFVAHGVTGVVHLAALTDPATVAREPLRASDVNVTGTAHLLAAMASQGVDAVVLSSSTAVHGTTSDDVTERTPTAPRSALGRSALQAEWLLRDQARAQGLRHTVLRYHEAAGAGAPELDDTSTDRLVPRVLDAVLTGRPVQVAGSGLATPDGTRVHDVVHVLDVAEAHVSAARALLGDAPLEPVYTLGSGVGVSEAQLVAAVSAATGLAAETVPVDLPDEEPPRVVVAGALAARDLGWRPTRTLDDVVASAWAARRPR